MTTNRQHGSVTARKLGEGFSACHLTRDPLMLSLTKNLPHLGLDKIWCPDRGHKFGEVRVSGESGAFDSSSPLCSSLLVKIARTVLATDSTGAGDRPRLPWS